MHTLAQSCRGLSLVVSLNADRLLFAAAIAGALCTAAYIGTV